MQAVSNPLFTCSNCGGHSFADRDGYRWCLACGTGEPIFEAASHVEGVGNDENVMHAPENLFAFGRNLGNPDLSNSKGLFEVLGRGGKENLGIRAIQVKSECMRAQETPISQRMLAYASALSKQFGLQEKFIFGNTLGYNLRWISTILTMMKDGSHSKDFAVATFLLTVQRFYGDAKAFEIMQVLWGRGEDKRVVPNSKKRFLMKAQQLIQLDKLL